MRVRELRGSETHINEVDGGSIVVAGFCDGAESFMSNHVDYFKHRKGQNFIILKFEDYEGENQLQKIYSDDSERLEYFIKGLAASGIPVLMPGGEKRYAPNLEVTDKLFEEQCEVTELRRLRTWELDQRWHLSGA